MTSPELEALDIAVVGGGPTGLTAGLYGARSRRRTVMFEGGVLGGQIANSDLVENYPGFPEGVNGFDLTLAMHQQAERFGMETVYERVVRLEREPERADGATPAYVLETESGVLYRARTLIVTSGAQHNQLGVPGEQELIGRGVSFCATCDAAFFEGQEVVVVGGGDAALDEALFTTRYASKVYIVHRRDELRASKVLQERAFASDKIEFIWDTVVEEIRASEDEGPNAGVRSVCLHNVKTDERRELPTSAVFIFIGQTPNSNFLEELVPLDKGGHAYVNLWMETELPGLFVAGDVRVEAAKQVVSAAGDGATAAIRADQYLSEEFPD
jgi:thioredoxin reductase (NADPH)